MILEITFVLLAGLVLGIALVSMFLVSLLVVFYPEVS